MNNPINPSNIAQSLEPVFTVAQEYLNLLSPNSNLNLQTVQTQINQLIGLLPLVQSSTNPLFVQQGLGQALGPNGLGWLQDINGDNTVNSQDITITSAQNNNIAFQAQLKPPIPPLTLTPEIANSLGLPNLGINVNSSASLVFDAQLQANFGWEGDRGFYVDTSPPNELTLQVNGGVLNVSLTSPLGSVQFIPQNNSSNLSGTVLIDVQDIDSNPTDNRIYLTDLSSIDPNQLLNTLMGASATNPTLNALINGLNSLLTPIPPGTPGNDVIEGTPIGDRIFGLQGNDLLFGGFGNDEIYGNPDNDTLLGNASNDLIHGGQGNDWLYGGQGNDTLSGDNGNDTLSGDLGADILTGGLGADVFMLRTSAAVNDILQADFITDFQVGIDRIALTPGTNPQNLILDDIAGNTVIRLSASGPILGIIGNVPPNSLEANSLIPIDMGMVS
ncbi:calcium-binding protein [Roseofilum reptotaenium CS-1145]|uniref:Calcium-binding protein n=1 Tax=Roseofilum reptotaenium AO1-A TaxID=1925591 RepID=A0A1L9QT82_9CYAN|nr:calcium-binding protein [Roseofilum reptotaenium]MDB9519098.1 calcium-binding protein [Roseofilum reptotaenium CS-1145]OJJ25852.1 hypothetical protein BI308_08935 [Roseofilum reptotaenium AO1-A]